MAKLKEEYRYMVNTKCRSSFFNDLHSAEDYAKSVQSDDVAIWVLTEDDNVVGFYERDFDGTYKEDKQVLNDKELLEKCKTSQPITEDDIAEHTDSVAILKSFGTAICESAIAGSISISDGDRTKHKPHVCTQEELDKLKMLQACKERDLLTIQAHHKLGYNDNNDSLYRTLRDRIVRYDKYMYAIKTGDASSVNLRLVTPMGIMEEEKSKELVQSNRGRNQPYDSLSDDEKIERINECLNGL